MSDYLAVNLANWNSRVPHHVQGYGLERYRSDVTYLSDVVRFDIPRLGSIAGLDVVHLQCHIGTDTLSLARLGARSVTGLDFSAYDEVAAGETHRFDDYAIGGRRRPCCWRWSRMPASARSATPTTPPTAWHHATCSSPTAARRSS